MTVSVFAAIVVLAVAAPQGASAQHITIDGRFSPAQTLVGPNYTIGANLGKQVGSNLFHSFGQFSLSNTPVPESATFTSTGSTGPISNVIGRVTGSNQSNIDGGIFSAIPGANLYLINPSGIVFGPHATVNVSGSFHASTADYLKMSDGARFQATNPDSSTLSAAPPAAFGFLTATPAQISVNGSTLGVPSGQTLGLVGGPVSITGPLPPGTTCTLCAPAGTIHVTSAAGTGEVPVDPRNTSALTVTSFGPVSVSGGSTLSVSNKVNLGSGGSVFIRSGALTIDTSQINADNYGAGAGGSVVVSVGGPLLIEGESTANYSGISSQSYGGGTGGNISVSAGALTIVDASQISSSTSGSGSAGPVSIAVAGSLAIRGIPPTGTGAAAIPTGITSRSIPGAAGSAGNISISAGCINIVSNGVISSATNGSGNAGNTSVTAAGLLAIDATGAEASFLTGITSRTNGGIGNAGNVRVSAGTLSLSNGGEITATNLGAGNGGMIQVTTEGALTLSGPEAGVNASAGPASSAHAGRIVVTAGGAIAVSDGAGIISGTAGTGDGGSIQVTAQGPLTMTGPATGISVLATATARGNAGSISVDAPQITLSANAGITSLTEGTGAGGAITVMTPGALTLNGGAAIGASAVGVQSGPGGPVTVVANTLTIGGGGAHIASETFGPGKGGNVNVNVVSDIVLTDPGPQITAMSTGSGDAGSVTVSAGRLLVANGAEISTEAETSKASGGNITLKVGDILYLTNGEITTSVNGETGNGGNITIDPQSVVLNQSNIIAQAIEGHGGNITINAGEFLQSSDSVVSATSALGISGTIEIIGPRVDLNGALVVLSSELRSAAQVLRNSCAAQAGLPQSSLVEGGRGGLPQDPDATLPALYIAGRDMSPTSPSVPGPPRAIPAQQTTARLTMRCS